MVEGRRRAGGAGRRLAFRWCDVRKERPGEIASLGSMADASLCVVGMLGVVSNTPSRRLFFFVVFPAV